MAGVNKVILVGRLGKDPEVRYMPNGGAVTSITLATSESWRDKQTGEKKELTEWHRVVFFNKLAEIAGEYLKKGSQVYVEGKLKTRKWQDQAGVERYTTEVVVDVSGTMQMLDTRTTGAPATSAQGDWGQPQQAGYQQSAAQASHAPAAQSARPAPQPQAAPPVYNEPPMDFDDDIPF